MRSTGISRNTAMKVSIAISFILVASLVIKIEAANNSTDLQFTIDSEPYGLTWGDWSAEFWKWDMSIPVDKSPAYEETGKNCGENQKGPVWFLVGTPQSGVPIDRKCTIPSDKAIFFSVIGSFYSYADTPTASTEADLRKAAFTPASKVEAYLDGISLGDLHKQWVTYPLFNVTLIKDNIFGAPPGLTYAVTNGYYVFLKPLSPGEHELRWVAEEPSAGNFTQDVTYHLNMTP